MLPMTENDDGNTSCNNLKDDYSKHRNSEDHEGEIESIPDRGGTGWQITHTVPVLLVHDATAVVLKPIFFLQCVY